MTAVTGTQASPTQLDNGTSWAIDVLNTGTVVLQLVPNGHRLQPGERNRVETSGNPVSAWTPTGTAGAVTVTTVAAPTNLPLTATGTKTSNYTAKAGDDVVVDTTSGNLATCVLPAALVGVKVQWTNVGTANSATIAPAGTDTIIDTATTSLTAGKHVLAQGQTKLFRCFVAGKWSRIG